jgi:AraC-like DNA-binding protein
MKKKEIKLLELATSQGGFIISPMIANYHSEAEVTDAFDPHRHDYYSVFLLAGGSIKMIIDAEVVQMTERSIILVSSGQVHHVVDLSEISGWVLSFDSKLVDQNARSAIEHKIPGPVHFSLGETDFNFYNEVCRIIYLESNADTAGKFQLQLIHSLINSCFYKFINLQTSSGGGIPGKFSSRPIELTQNFKELVSRNFSRLKKPADYALLLNISVSHLNDTVKQTTGFPATWFIHQEVVAEAQRQLMYGSKNVKEIATRLGYDDDKYFIRLFTKIVGLSPLKFRKSKEHNHTERS